MSDEIEALCRELSDLAEHWYAHERRTAGKVMAALRSLSRRVEVLQAELARRTLKQRPNTRPPAAPVWECGLCAEATPEHKPDCILAALQPQERNDADR